jgi:hypothetical protein
MLLALARLRASAASPIQAMRSPFTASAPFASLP